MAKRYDPKPVILVDENYDTYSSSGAGAGSTTVSNFPSNQPVTVTNFPSPQTVTVGNFPGTQPVSGTVNTIETGAATATVAPTQIATSTTSATLASSLATRKSVVIYNSATTNLLVAFAATASATVFTTQITPGGTLVIPRETWTGVVSGILTTGTGSAQVTVTS